MQIIFHNIINQFIIFAIFGLRIPADNDDFRKRRERIGKMLFYFESFKYPASPHPWHFRSEALMFTIRIILTSRRLETSHQTTGESENLSTEIKQNILIIVSSSRFDWKFGTTTICIQLRGDKQPFDRMIPFSSHQRTTAQFLFVIVTKWIAFTAFVVQFLVGAD